MLGDEDQEIYPMAFFIVKRPLLRRGFVHTIRAEITKVGRHEGDIRLETDLRVSNPHARIRRSTNDKGEDSYVLIDMDSRGGTHVNGNRIDGRHVLIENDEVRIGEHVFVFKVLWD
jgi:pSer/pThr/pTyr-binding forkhead associated (FHA) protein